MPGGVIVQTAAALEASGDGSVRHEGLVYWAGWIAGSVTVIGFAIVPKADHGWGHVRADEAAMLDVAREARRHRAGVLVQVHSHPGRDTRHSDGDDSLVHLPFEGMWSVVVGEYGQGFDHPIDSGIGLHQYQDGRWVRILRPSEAWLILPSVVTL